MMINLYDYPIFIDNLSTLKMTSKDDHDGKSIYMTESMLGVVDFDRVKEEYIKELGVKESPKSNDALFIDVNGIATFIEFKNGRMNQKKQHDVRRKIFDSMLIFTDIVEKGIKHSRIKMNYILVYNEDVNRENEDIQHNEVQLSRERDQIAKSFIRLGKGEYIKFGLEIFEKYCFNEVHTYTKQEFEDKFVDTIK